VSKCVAGLRLGGLTILAMGLTASLALSPASAASKPKPGVGPGGLTSARLCSLVSAQEAQGLLGGKTPAGPGTPQTENVGSAQCTWAAVGGANNSLSVSRNVGTKGCDGISGKDLHFDGTTACLPKPKIEVGMEVGKGKYYLEFFADGVSANSNLTSTMEKVATQVFEDLHA
jgi:hypothetical protein